tara:strand:+ start:104 stop:325 length:222 start_codon:yes stop_codon:yes gene_type:complete
MPKIKMKVIQENYKSWLALKKSVEKVPGAKIQSFGKQMNIVHSLNNDTLEKETDPNVALLMLMKDHVNYKEDI